MVVALIGLGWGDTRDTNKGGKQTPAVYLCREIFSRFCGDQGRLHLREGAPSPSFLWQPK